MKKKLIMLLTAALVCLPMATSVNAEEKLPDNTINLYFVRHGKTILNTLDRVQGWSDALLTEEGIQLAKDTAAGMADIKFDFVYSSDRVRATHTAKIIMEANIVSGEKEIRQLAGLRETNFGKYEGEKNEVMWGEALAYLGLSDMHELLEIENGTVKAFDAIAANDETGEAESVEEVQARLMSSIELIIEEVSAGGGGNVLIVGHGAAIGKIINNLSGANVGELPNTSVSIIQYNNGEFIVKTIGDTSYTSVGHSKREEESEEVIIYLIRHGKTVFNTMDRVQGWVDSPLTDEGIKMTENLGRGLNDIEFTAAYTSDLGRATQTAQIIFENNKVSKIQNINERAGLRETYYGKYEGGFNSEMLKVAIDYYDVEDREELMSMDNSLAKVIDVLHESDETGMAENYTQMSARVVNEFKKLAEEVAENNGGNVLVISHGNAIMAIINTLEQGHNVTEIDNASVSKIIYKNGRFTIESINDTSYIEKG